MSFVGVLITQVHMGLGHKRYILYNKVIYITKKSISHLFHRVFTILFYLFFQPLQIIHSMMARKDHRLSVDVNFSIALETKKKKL